MSIDKKKIGNIIKIAVIGTGTACRKAETAGRADVP